ncbi:MAG: class I SAM-dependent methyltransferase [bacterium]
MSNSPWYQSWFGADYLQVYQHRSQQEAAATIDWLLTEVGLESPARVLDVACGSGRHSLQLAERGFAAYGFDLSWQLLTQAVVQGSHPRFYRVRGDMKRLPFRSGSMALVLSLFTSFGYFETQEEDRFVIREIVRLLEAGGTFVLDFLNSALIAKELVPEGETDFNGKRVSIFKWVDEPRNRIEKRILIQEPNGAKREYRESVYLYSFSELQEILKNSGITVRSVFGDYAGGVYSSQSPRIILIGIKNG